MTQFPNNFYTFHVFVDGKWIAINSDDLNGTNGNIDGYTTGVEEFIYIRDGLNSDDPIRVTCVDLAAGTCKDVTEGIYQEAVEAALDLFDECPEWIDRHDWMKHGGVYN